MASFPAPFNGVAALYPLTIAKRYPVEILQFDDRTEQRWRESAGVARLVLQFEQITKTEKDAIVAFFGTTKGSFDSTWDITLNGTLYSYLAFSGDAITATETEPGMWSMRLEIVQTRKN